MLSRDPLRNPEPLIRRVYAYVAYRIGDGPDAEDVTSETFERALRYRDSFDPSRGEPAGWLIGIARRVMAEAGAERSRRRDLAAEGLDAGRDVAALDDVEAATTGRLALAAALAELDERDRELLALRYGADLTAAQIGEIVDARPNAVDVALHRARARLRDRLAGEVETGVPAVGL